MRIEHLVFSAALAIVLGMLYYRYTRRDPSWIIVISAFSPDIDLILSQMRCWFGIPVAFNGHLIHHGDFHSIGMLLVYAVVVGVVLVPLGVRFLDGVLFAGIGFGAHLFEDALVFKISYALLWPFSDQIYGIGLLTYSPDFYGIADSRVLVAGLILLAGAITLRATMDRTWCSWILEGIKDPMH